MPETFPHGFRRATASGLIVPDEVSRVREVWTKAELKLVDRAIRLLKSRNVLLQLACPEPDCRGEKIAMIRQADGTVVWRCSHKDRIFSNAF